MTRDYCLFCGKVFIVEMHESCRRVCDGGEHEGMPRPGHESYNPRAEVRRGFSLHIDACPRSNPWPDLPLSVPCWCSGVPRVAVAS
jgi:hypothetical protein